MPGTLFIVSTPIGNLEDMTLRAIRVLKEADIIAAEDTRHSRKLLTHFGIGTPMMSYWGEKEKVKAEEVMAHLMKGETVALISDAGTPGISDPGAVLIRRAIEDGVEIVPVPGPSALAAAVTISGLPTEQFVFIGFMPNKRSQRRKALEELASEPRTMVFYESPHRIFDTLVDIEEVFGSGRRAAVAKEITKLHERVLRGTLETILDAMETETIAGEYVIVVDGAPEDEAMTEDDAMERMRELVAGGASRKDASRMVADESGLSRKMLYNRSLK